MRAMSMTGPAVQLLLLLPVLLCSGITLVSSKVEHLVLYDCHSSSAWFTIRRWRERNQRRIVNEFYVGTLGALVRATVTLGIDWISIRALASVTLR